jgi:hypothetical protein
MVDLVFDSAAAQLFIVDAGAEFAATAFGLEPEHAFDVFGTSDLPVDGGVCLCGRACPSWRSNARAARAVNASSP